MTQQEFDRLPGLLSRKIFLQITGLSRQELTVLRREGKLKRYHGILRKGRSTSYDKYYKSDAAKYAGFKM